MIDRHFHTWLQQMQFTHKLKSPCVQIYLQSWMDFMINVVAFSFAVPATAHIQEMFLYILWPLMQYVCALAIYISALSVLILALANVYIDKSAINGCLFVFSK